uniref:Uncharacterized protein n=1 Tax=Anguilla anguilla TaxID=7936 RepID=A0A0E9Q7I5_ANGAN
MELASDGRFGDCVSPRKQTYTYTTFSSMWTPGHHIHMYLKISFRGLILSYTPPFAAVRACTLLGRLSSRFWEHGCGDSIPFSHKSISEVGH